MIFTGQTFASFEFLKHALQEWSIIEKFSTRVAHKDKQRVDYRCHTYKEQNKQQNNTGSSSESSSCPFRVYATKQKDSDNVEVRIVETEHTCLGVRAPKRDAANSQEWLIRVVPKLLTVSKDTTPHQIIDVVRHAHGQLVNYQAALHCRNTLANAGAAAHAYQFFYLPAYIDTLKQQSPYCYTNLTTLPSPSDANPSKRIFRRVFICPAESQLAFNQSRRFVALDGTHLKGFFQQTLLLAAGIDANGQYIIYAWAVVESENKDAWEYFLQHLKLAMPQILEASLMSDRDKGLQSAEDVLGPNVTRLFCLQHLKRSFQVCVCT